MLAALLLVVAACTSGDDPLATGDPSGPGEIPDTAAVPPPADGIALNGVTGPLFPPDNWWNRDISNAPVSDQSDRIIDWICRRAQPTGDCSARLHPDFGPPPYGIPYVVVPSSQPRVPVHFVLYGDESDPGAPGEPGYPIPAEASTEPGLIEGGEAGGGGSGDRHLLIVDRDRRLLFETWATRWNPSAERWEAGSGAVFDLTTNARRPEGWTSADAAGLAVLPGIVKYHEATGEEEISHAFRVTVRSTNGYVWPASHRAGSDLDAPPLGTRLRLKADVDISAHPPQLQRIFRAMRRYGLIVADNGSDMFVQGTMDARWDNDLLNPAFHALNAADFEVIELGWRP
jgi:hypothetical protein